MLQVFIMLLKLFYNGKKLSHSPRPQGNVHNFSLE